MNEEKPSKSNEVQVTGRRIEVGHSRTIFLSWWRSTSAYVAVGAKCDIDRSAHKLGPRIKSHVVCKEAYFDETSFARCDGVIHEVR